jgi:NitT/TauT family transport system ATP-binding protein
VKAAAGIAGPPLAVEHVAKSYDLNGQIVPVIGDLSLTLREGEIISIVGPSGCGKTTLLNTLCGLLAPDSGHIRWHGREVSGQPQNVGYMLQKDLLLPWRTALGNTLLGLQSVALRRPRRRTRAAPCSTSSAFMASLIIIPRRCRAACASGWRWREPW